MVSREMFEVRSVTKVLTIPVLLASLAAAAVGIAIFVPRVLALGASLLTRSTGG